jgi:hypothetical protein
MGLGFQETYDQHQFWRATSPLTLKGGRRKLRFEMMKTQRIFVAPILGTTSTQLRKKVLAIRQSGSWFKIFNNQ